MARGWRPVHRLPRATRPSANRITWDVRRTTRKGALPTCEPCRTCEARDERGRLPPAQIVRSVLVACLVGRRLRPGEGGPSRRRGPLVGPEGAGDERLV